jgi:hypothetical protein
MSSVIDDVVKERARQDEKWGEQNHPDLPAAIADLSSAEIAAVLGIATAPVATRSCESAFAVNSGSWSRILIEEVAEVVEAAAVRDSASLRRELIEVAAVAVAWAEAIDRRSKEKTV